MATEKGIAGWPLCATLQEEYRTWIGRRSGKMFCGKCGNQVFDGANICPNCGAPLNNSASNITGNHGDGTYTLTINRANQLYAVNPVVKIVVDGGAEYKIDNGETLNIPIEAGAHNIAFSCSIRHKTVSINVSDNVTLGIHWNRITGSLEVEEFTNTTQNADATLSNGVVNSKYAWCLATIPILISWILGGIGLSYWVVTICTLALNIVFLTLDSKELKKSGTDVNSWMWMGVVLVPVYLFIRASRTDKIYIYAITWCLIFLVDLLISDNWNMQSF